MLFETKKTKINTNKANIKIAKHKYKATLSNSAGN